MQDDLFSHGLDSQFAHEAAIPHADFVCQFPLPIFRTGHNRRDGHVGHGIPGREETIRGGESVGCRMFSVSKRNADDSRTM